MKKITRFLCLALCIAMLVPGMIGCAKGDTTTGAQINMYLSSEVYNFDPAYAHLDTSATKLVGMMFEGIMKINEKGKLEKALCDSWEYKEDMGIDKESDADNKYTLTIHLKKSGWSDGRRVSADEFVFAWKRLLDPDFDGEGAELLFDIKGAYERKNQGLSPDDIGLYADGRVLTIEFKHSIDPKDFLRKTASLSLMPLRRDRVDYYYSWSSANTTIVTNGPFTLLTYYPGSIMELGRNTYYHHNTDDEDNLPNPSKYVKPYKIVVDFTLNSEAMMKKYEEGQLFYISELPASKEVREQYKKKVELYDTFTTHMYVFNTKIAPFDKPEVREILSKVISRNEIVDEIVFGKPATGIVPGNISDKKGKDDFAENNDSKISADAMSIEEAKSALSAAGVNPSDYSFKLTVRVNADSKLEEGTGTLKLKDIKFSNERIYETVDYVVAQKVIAKWRELGFNCEINCVNAKQYMETTSNLTQYRDVTVESLYGTHGDGILESYMSGKDENGDPIYDERYIKVERGGFDVIAIDYQLLDTTAFSALAVYASEYSGAQSDENFKTFGHVSGYVSEAYDKLIAEADAARIAGDTELLSAKLHEAEKLLIKEAPVMPIFVYQDAVLANKDLSRYDRDGWGTPVFNSVKLKNWENYLPSSEKEDTEE